MLPLHIQLPAPAVGGGAGKWPWLPAWPGAGAVPGLGARTPRRRMLSCRRPRSGGCCRSLSRRQLPGGALPSEQPPRQRCWRAAPIPYGDPGKARGCSGREGWERPPGLGDRVPAPGAAVGKEAPLPAPAACPGAAPQRPPRLGWVPPPRCSHPPQRFSCYFLKSQECNRSKTFIYLRDSLVKTPGS